MPDVSRAEWKAWETLVGQLRATRVVTDADCLSRATDPPDTPGRQLFAAIRAWGDAYAKLVAHDRSLAWIEGVDRRQ